MLFKLRKSKPKPKPGQFAYYLLELHTKAEEQRQLVETLAQQAWHYAKARLEEAAREMSRKCQFQVKFEGSEGGNEHLSVKVQCRLIQIAKAEGVTIARPLSWRDHRLNAEW